MRYKESIGMNTIRYRSHGRTDGHGALFLCHVLVMLPVTAKLCAQDAVPSHSRVFDIEYVVNDNAQPLDLVQLWYTLDRGNTWQEYGLDQDRQSPITFHAPQEGLYGFYLILTNKTGASGGAPTPATTPHQWVFVDYTKPVVQLHKPRQTTSMGERVLQIRWTAIDSNLTPRPITISYQRRGQTNWYSASAESLGNTGRYDWKIPEGLSGPVSLRVMASDQGGYRVSSESQMVDIAPAPTMPLVSQPMTQPLTDPGTRPMTYPASQPATHPTTQPNNAYSTMQPVRSTMTRDIRRAISPLAQSQPSRSSSQQAKNRARRLFSEAVALRDEKEYRLGISRLREAVRLDPQLTEAFVEMAGILYRIGDTERSLSAYDIALRQNPGMRSALQGSALVHSQLHDYSSAAKQLRTVLRYNPNDSEIWMNLGDVAIYQGDEVLARECYLRATRGDPEATQVIEDAHRRLELMADVSRTYRP